jgi:hypothetical protein
MAQPRFLAETDSAERRPERVLEGRVFDYRAQLLSHLRAQSLERHAALFAEPMLLEGRIRWRTDQPGEPRPFAELPPETQERAQQVVGTLLTEVRNEAARLRQGGSPSQRRLAEVLDRATQGMAWPDLWLLTEPGTAGSEPRETYVLAGWGLAAAEGRPPLADLLGQSLFVASAAQAMPEPAPTTPPVDRRAWPLRLLALAAVLLLLGGLLAWQLPALAGVLLGLRLPEPPVCEMPPESGLPPLQQEEARLRARLAQLERAYSGRVIQCRIASAPPPAPPPPPPAPAPAPTPAPAPPPPPTAPPPPQRSELDQRLDRERAQRSNYQVTLSWDGPADLDLHIDCPDGGQIFWQARANCGGRLDVDMNGGERQSTRPVENVFWAETPPSGTWRVRVVYYDYEARRTPVPFRVRIVTDGNAREVTGTATRTNAPPVAEFRVP